MSCVVRKLGFCDPRKSKYFVRYNQMFIQVQIQIMFNSVSNSWIVVSNVLQIILREFEDTNVVIRINISKKDRQYNGQKKKDKQRSTKHTQTTKDRVTRTPLKTEGELRCSGRVSSSCSTSDTHSSI